MKDGVKSVHAHSLTISRGGLEIQITEVNCVHVQFCVKCFFYRLFYWTGKKPKQKISYKKKHELYIK